MRNGGLTAVVKEHDGGNDIVDEVVRLCAMNLYLHGIDNGESPIRRTDAPVADPGEVDTEREDFTFTMRSKHSRP